MRVSFRHGIVRAPQNFLSLSNKQVDLVIQPNEPIIASVADRYTNYLLTERESVQGAWIGPFEPGQDYWLYWDINIVTGVVTRGYTTVEPVRGIIYPNETTVDDQYWFDLVNNESKVWINTGWVRRIRLFAAKLTQGAIFTGMSVDSQSFLGSQVGNYTNVSTGSILYDPITRKGIKRSDGIFITTEDNISTGMSSSSLVKFGSLVMEAIANNSIPAYSIVHYMDYDLIELATNYLMDNGIYGIVDKSYQAGEAAQVIIDGVIQNMEWDWSHLPINTPLYVNEIGELTPDVPPTPIIVAVIVDVHTILLRPSSLYANHTNDPATIDNMGSVYMSIQPDDITHPVAVGDNDPRIMSIMEHIGDDTVHVSPTAIIQVDSVIAKTFSNMLVELPSNVANVEWDMLNGTMATLELGSDVNIANPLNAPAGSTVLLKIKQDSTGGYNVTFGNYFKFASDPNVSLTPNSSTIFYFLCDGNYLFEISKTSAII